MANRAKRTGAVAAAVAAVLAGCSMGSAGEEREVLVDYRHDEFASSMIDFFPDVVRVHAGATVRFRQSWTGEPHSVTFGAAFNDELGAIRARLGRAPAPTAEELDALGLRTFDELPAMLGRPGDEFVVNQNGAQPCYLDDGLPPTDPDARCAPRPQPRFTGKHSYYSSGFIPYRGARSNSFELHLADDIAPGSYHFYCNLHGVAQSGTVVVVGDREEVPSSGATKRAAYERMRARFAQPLRTALSNARRDALVIDDRHLSPPLAGVAEDHTKPWAGLGHRRHFDHRHGAANEFVPQRVDARVGQPVTWTFVGRHTISFNVPPYLPVFGVGDGGTVTFDERVHEPAGWPGRPPVDGPAHVDAGEWDGAGFRSSGLDWRTGDTFSVTFTRAGTYPVACLVHPHMVGSVRVAR